MPQLTTQFREALKRVEPTTEDKTNAPKAHNAVRDALAENPTLNDWGLDPILIGSYARDVSIRRMKDVDVFGRLPGVPDSIGPDELLRRFEEALVDAFGRDRITRQARSIQVGFPELEGLYVDAVPARPWTSPAGEDAWQLPKRGESGWQATNPEQLTQLKTDLNAEFDKLYVPVVKLLRQTRRSLMGKRKPGGLTVEIAAALAFQSGDVAGTTIGDLYVSALRRVGTELHNAFVLGLGLDDPTLSGEQILVRGDDADKTALAKAFLDAGERAQGALVAGPDDKCRSAKVFQDILGKAVDDQGDQDHVFPMPDDCNLDGTPKDFSRARAGDPVIAGGDRRFG